MWVTIIPHDNSKYTAIVFLVYLPPTYRWPMGSLWGSWEASGRRRWRSREQRGSWRSLGQQTAGWRVPRLWSSQTGCRTELPGRGRAGRQTGRWIYPRAPAAPSWQLHTESHVCCPPGRPIRNQRSEGAKTGQPGRATISIKQIMLPPSSS